MVALELAVCGATEDLRFSDLENSYFRKSGSRNFGIGKSESGDGEEATGKRQKIATPRFSTRFGRRKHFPPTRRNRSRARRVSDNEHLNVRKSVFSGIV